jgi:hypothetical protein
MPTEKTHILLTKEDLQTVFREAFDERNTIGGEQHHTEHSFIQVLMEREQRRINRLEKFKMSFVGAVAVALVSGLVWLGTLTWNNINHITPPH